MAAPEPSSPRFADGGIVTTAFPASAVSAASAVAIQPDGKVVAVGRSGGRFALARYDANGGLDATFGSGGTVVTDVGGRARPAATAIEPDGKIVVAGSVAGPGPRPRIAVARYNPDGSLDPSFGRGGVARTGVCCAANAAAFDRDGRIVVAGEVDGAFGVVRLTARGALDRSFGASGAVSTGFGGRSAAGGRANALAIGPDGGIIAAGATPGGDFALARFDADGSLDASFGAGGRVRTDLGGDDEANAVVLRPGGGIVLAGRTSTGLALAAYRRSGSPDGSFAERGRVVDPSLDGAAGAIRAAGGGIEVATRDFRVVRYHPDGLLDPSFGADGVATPHFAGDARASAMVAGPSGEVVAAGATGACAPGAASGCAGGLALARLDASGSLDPSFGSGGTVESGMPAGRTADAEARAILVAPERKVLVAGSAASGGRRDLALARYRADGSLDASFGVGGRVATDPGGARGGAALAEARQRNGRIILAGYSDAGPGGARRPTLIRYLADGSLDRSFGDGGVVVADLCCAADAVVAAPDGRILVGARTRGGYVVARYQRDGTVDRSFGNRGRVALSGAGLRGSAGGGVVLEPDGKIVVAGGRGGFTLVRLRPDGAIDRSFGHRGSTRTRLGAASSASGALPVARGRIVVYGDSGGRIAVARYRPDGTLDRRFGERGVARGPRHAFAGGVASAAVASGGRIVVAGTARHRFALVRFEPDGALDRSLGRSGTLVSAVRGRAAAVAAAPGHLLVAGSAPAEPGGTRSRFELARLHAAATVPRRSLAGKRQRSHPDSPHPVPAFYINAGNFRDMKRLAASDVCSYARSQPPRAHRALILDFGGARAYGNGTYGAAVNNATFPANNRQIKEALKTAADAYAACHKRGQAKIVYAVTNHFKSKSSATHAHRIGRHQAATVKQVWRYVRKRGYYPAERAGVGGDIEMGYWGPAHSKAMVDGAKAVWDRGYLDFGTAGGCPPHPRGLSAPPGRRCFNDWTLEDVAHVSNSGGGDPAPEVYYRGDRVHFDQAAQWANVARNWNGGHATPYRFFGATGSTEFSALTPGESWRRLRTKVPGHVGRELLNFKQDRWTAAHKGG